MYKMYIGVPGDTVFSIGSKFVLTPITWDEYTDDLTYAANYDTPTQALQAFAAALELYPLRPIVRREGDAGTLCFITNGMGDIVMRVKLEPKNG